jgi:8-oxo-dGTP pyrophosphatase MutT (NUDIX family)
MVKKSTTYCFNEFVLARYDKHNDEHLIKLFNGMTYHEKMDILNMKFSNLWYRVYKENFDNTTNTIGYNSYLKKKSKFESCFMQDGGRYLRNLLSRSTHNTDTPWEFPRGRRLSNEQEIDIAIREFHEETGINSSYYRIKYHIKPFIISYKDYGIIYKSTYYFAELVKDYEPVYSFDKFAQMSEIAAVKWVNMLDLIALDIDKVAKARLIKQFGIVKKIIKNHTKLILLDIYRSDVH